MPFSGRELRTLVVAPVGRDAEAMADALQQHGVNAMVCASLSAAAFEIRQDAGALLVTEEGLSTPTAADLIAALDEQPSWSALPIVVLTAGSTEHRSTLLHRLGLAVGAVTLLERPVHQAHLLSAVKTALAARRRQYEVRDLLEDRARRERLLAEQADKLRRSEARFREMADAAPAMLWVTDAEHRCRFLSRVWYEQTGAEARDGQDPDWLEPLHPEDAAATRQAFLAATRSLEAFQLDYRLRTTGGDYRWVTHTARPRYDPSGRFAGYLGSITDVHALRLAEQEQERTRVLLDAVLESLPVGVVIADGNGRLVRWNRTYQKLWGLAPDDRPSDTDGIGGYRRWRGWHSDTGKPVEPEEWTLARAVLTRAPVPGTLLEIERFDGGGRRFLINGAAPVFDQQGRLIAAVGAQTDVTRGVQMERALRESEEKFRTLADNIAQLAWMADADGRMIWHNRRAVEYLGRTLDEIRDAGWEVIHHPDHVERVMSRLRHCYETGEPWEDTFPLRGHDGSYRWFLSRAVPLRDAEGRVTCWFGTNTDVTEQREAQEALREADRRKDEFIATLAHELRNPLAPIRTAVELLGFAGSEQGPDPETLAACRDVIDRQVRDLTRLVDDLLEVSRITRGKFELRREPVRLAAVVEHALEAARPLIDACRHALEVGLPEEEVWLMADATRLAQVLVNLLNNAARYTPAGGRIAVEAVVEEREVRVSVSDTGIGIPPEHLSGIFEMFSQVTPAVSRSGGGLGIGLALARGLVELHGGVITASSDGEGRGSRFTVRLPRAERPRAAPHPPRPSHSRMQARRILVVDDNHDTADGLARILRLMGHEVQVAYDGPEALAMVERDAPDVVLLDIGLPTMSGYEVARRIRGRPGGRDLCLVAQTGWGQPQDKKRSAEAGFDHHLVKPVDSAVLSKLLSGLADGHHPDAVAR